MLLPAPDKCPEPRAPVEEHGGACTSGGPYEIRPGVVTSAIGVTSSVFSRKDIRRPPSRAWLAWFGAAAAGVTIGTTTTWMIAS